ncbi:DUF418 domain-containing protein [Parasphingorhabdus pacifica]
MGERSGVDGLPAAAAGPTAVRARSPAPDLARGYVLLVIALANAHVFLFGGDLGVRRYPLVETLPDRLVTLLQMMLVDGRAYPMFAALFGYSLVQLIRRQTSEGVRTVTLRRLILCRAAALLLFGFVHGLLLFSGDIIGAYGLLAFLLGGMLCRARDRTLLLVAGLWLIPVTILGALQGLPVHDAAQSLVSSMSTSNPLDAAALRMEEWFKGTLRQVLLSLVPAVLFGAWTARRRVLDEPELYRTWLGFAAVAGSALAVAGGLPMALKAASFWPEPDVVPNVLAGVLHTLTGYAGGIGYAAIAGLVAVRCRDRPGRVSGALIACGQRSMTCYVAQSVVFVAVLAAYGGGLGDDVGVSAASCVALGAWLGSTVLALGLRRLGRRGPLEILLRRLTYGAAGLWR